MRFWPLLLAGLLLASCSDSPAPTKTKEPEKPPEPLTGREAFYKTYPPARAWSLDAQPLSIRSIDLDQVKAEPGKAAAWEAKWVSVSKGRSKIFTWSAIEAEGNLHKGVFAGLEESWRAGEAKPFAVQALKIDTPEALETAIKHSDAYFKKGSTEKPHPKFILEFTSRYPDPVWRIFWGDSVSTAQWNVFVDSATGEYQGR